MERGFNRRAELFLDVVLFDKGLPIAVGKAQDISLLGMFVTGPVPDLRKHQLIEVRFKTESGQEGTWCRLPAMVVQTSREGLGLIFDTSDPDTRVAIRKLKNMVQREGEGESFMSAQAHEPQDKQGQEEQISRYAS